LKNSLVNLYIHGGLSKTGTSSVQEYFYQRAESYKEKSLYYPLNNEFFKSGNIEEELRHCSYYRYEKTIRKSLRTAVNNAVSCGCTKLFYSSELISTIPKESLDLFLKIATSEFCNVSILIINRDPYDWYFLSWVQSIMCDGNTKLIGESLNASVDFSLHPLKTARYIREFFPSISLSEIEYENHKDDVIPIICNFLDVPCDNTVESAVINRRTSIPNLLLQLAKNKSNINSGFEKLNLIDNSHLIPLEIVVDATVLKTVNKYCADNNIKISSRLSHDIEYLNIEFYLKKLSIDGRFFYDCILTMYEAIKNNLSITLNEMYEHCAFFDNSPYKKKVPRKFNALIYLMRNQDVFLSNADPYEHYVKFGKLESRIFL